MCHHTAQQRYREIACMIMADVHAPIVPHCDGAEQQGLLTAAFGRPVRDAHLATAKLALQTSLAEPGCDAVASNPARA